MYVIVSENLWRSSWTDCSICFFSVLIDFRFAISTNLSIYVTLIGILWELELVKECHYHDILTWWNDSSICSSTCFFVVLTLGFLLLIFVFESSSPCSNDHGYIPLVVSIFWCFPHSRFITGFVNRVIRQVLLVEQELLTLPEHLSSSSF